MGGAYKHITDASQNEIATRIVNAINRDVPVLVVDALNQQVSKFGKVMLGVGLLGLVGYFAVKMIQDNSRLRSQLKICRTCYGRVSSEASEPAETQVAPTTTPQ